MKSLKNKIWLGVLVILIFILFLQHLNGNNLDKFRVLDKKPYYSIMFDYTGKPNLPEMIGVIRPNIIGVKRLFAEKDYEFADNTSKEKSKTGGIIELKGKGKYRGTMKVKIYVYDKYPYGKPQTDEVARGSGNREYGCRRLREKLPNFSGVSFFRAGNSSNRVNAFHICVYVHRCAVPRYIALQYP